MSQANSNSGPPAVTTNEVVLTPKISSKWALSPALSLVIASWCVVFTLFNYFPLQSPLLWSDLTYGDWMLEHRALPQQDPVLPLAEGMPVLHSRWLTQVVLAGVASAGDDWLQVCFAVTTLLTFVLLTRAYALRCGNAGIAGATGLLVLLLTWTRYTTFLPEHLAGVCMGLLLWLIAGGSRWVISENQLVRKPTLSGERVAGSATRAGELVGVAGLFVVWSNLDSSFLWGLLILACLFLGELVSAWTRLGSVRSVLADPAMRHALYRCELALVASLFNPVGIDLMLRLLWFGQLDNLKELVEWQPLPPLNRDGWGFAISVLLMLVVFRRSRVQVPASSVLLLLAFSAAALWQRRFVHWYAPIFGYVMVPHFADVWLQYRSYSAQKQSDLIKGQPELSTAESSAEDEAAAGLPPWTYTLVSLLLIWLAFSLTGISRPLLGGKPRSPEQLYGPAAPLQLAEFPERASTRGHGLNALGLE